MSSNGFFARIFLQFWGAYIQEDCVFWGEGAGDRMGRSFAFQNKLVKGVKGVSCCSSRLYPRSKVKKSEVVCTCCWHLYHISFIPIFSALF